MFLQAENLFLFNNCTSKIGQDIKEMDTFF